MLGCFYTLVDGHPECKLAGGAAGTPIKDVWAIHVTGAARRRGCLQAVRRRPRQARRVPTHPRRRWRGSPRSMAGDEVLVAHRFRGRRRVYPPGSPSRQRVPVRDRARRTGLRLSGYPRKDVMRRQSGGFLDPAPLEVRQARQGCLLQQVRQRGRGVESDVALRARASRCGRRFMAGMRQSEAALPEIGPKFTEPGLSDAQVLQILDRGPHLASAPRRSVVAFRQPWNTGGAAHGDELDPRCCEPWCSHRARSR